MLATLAAKGTARRARSSMSTSSARLSVTPMPFSQTQLKASRVLATPATNGTARRTRSSMSASSARLTVTPMPFSQTQLKAFSCACHTGHEGDGETCSVINEYVVGTVECGTNAVFTNTVEGFLVCLALSSHVLVAPQSLGIRLEMISHAILEAMTPFAEKFIAEANAQGEDSPRETIFADSRIFRILRDGGVQKLPARLNPS